MFSEKELNFKIYLLQNVTLQENEFLSFVLLQIHGDFATPLSCSKTQSQKNHILTFLA